MGSRLKNEKLLQQISIQLKRHREKKELTQEDVYNDTGIHISRIETGKVNITVSTLAALCDYFDLNLSEFFEKL
ncbi:helix-turn-helix domain-containing protein [Salegentibacter sp. LM13S]|jgi:transcriptional regulator with XRE-family HTH domain|uniref:helix-turn-helix domain-containing protein n=1 Tax=Salegentibacter lacus TaxID=2873599 RepID=UPI001CCB8B3F|nr:helix-turn-helix transcriptional regulator [Salegentibacter lacus]MBZ9631733.1 helix-turn-helix domain-containing protein [Salegentibacter lacus]|tara:strand:- start:926 stop:1147 length:222 start_codon:yes stop_codon:yes gene_type:complete